MRRLSIQLRGVALAHGATKRLASAQEADILPLSTIAEKEGMSEAEFRGRYASTDITVYAATLRRINATLAGVR